MSIVRGVVTLTVFLLCAGFVFKTDKRSWNHAAGFVQLVAAVYVIFKNGEVESASPRLIFYKPHAALAIHQRNNQLIISH